MRQNVNQVIEAAARIVMQDAAFIGDAADARRVCRTTAMRGEMAHIAFSADLLAEVVMEGVQPAGVERRRSPDVERKRSPDIEAVVAMLDANASFKSMFRRALRGETRAQLHLLLGHIRDLPNATSQQNVLMCAMIRARLRTRRNGEVAA